MDKKHSLGMNDIRALSGDELDAVSGGATVKLYDITVLGMRIVGVANTSNGHNATWVQGPGTLVINAGTQQ